MHGFRIALISHEFPPYTIGGIGSHCYDLAHNLAKKGVETKVLCGTTDGVEKTTRVNSHLEVTRLPFLNFPPRYFWFQTINYKKICALTSDCSVIHGANPLASLSLAFYLRNSSKVTVTTHHLNELQTLKMYVQTPLSELTLGDLAINALSYPLDDYIERTWFKYADRIVVPGHSTYEFMERILPRKYLAKISVIYNGIDLDKIEGLSRDAQRERAMLDRDESSIVCFCRLVSLKGIGQLLKNIKPLFSDFPSTHLKIFGGGPLRNILVKHIHKSGLDENVSIMGHVPYEELIAQVSEASVAVFPTFLEVGPFISALEAMACRRPIVVFDLPFNREFVRHLDNGVVARAGDMIDFIGSIELLLGDPKLGQKIGENAYSYVKQNHNWALLVDKYIELYEATLHR
jgi:glycosyltransferase involved in cell wall biosynthesis